MPTYSYQCKKCDSVQDVFHAMSAEPRIKCDSCGGGTKKLMGTGAGIIFKGSGFYETDYKEKKGKAPSDSKKSEKKAESSKSSGDSDTKKSESKSSKKASSSAS